MRRTVRLLTVVLLTVGTLGVVLPGSAGAAPVLKVKCIGDQVRRCLEVHVDSGSGVYRVWGRIIDTDGGGDYNVDVVSVGLAQDPDFSGTVDTAPGGLNLCQLFDAPTEEHTHWATFRWRNVNSGQPATEGRLSITVTRYAPGCALS